MEKLQELSFSLWHGLSLCIHSLWSYVVLTDVLLESSSFSSTDSVDETAINTLGVFLLLCFLVRGQFLPDMIKCKITK